MNRPVRISLAHCCPGIVFTNPCPSWLPVGTLVPASSLAVSTDAVSKACHFKSAGRSQSGIAPSTSTYLGSIAAQVIMDHGSGVLRSEAKSALRWPPRSELPTRRR